MSVTITSLGAERLVAVNAPAMEAVPFLARFTTLQLAAEEFLCLDASAHEVASVLDRGALVVDSGDAYAGWVVDGPDARDLLARACALDFEMMAIGAATRCLMGGVSVVLRLLPASRYELRVERSYAEWFELWLRGI